jgi:hypothetical protein
MVPAALGKAIYPIDKSSLSPLRLLTFHCNHGRRRAFDHINIAASDEFIHHCVSPMRRKRFTVLLRKRVVVVCRQYVPEPVFRWNYHADRRFFGWNWRHDRARNALNLDEPIRRVKSKAVLTGTRGLAFGTDKRFASLDMHRETRPMSIHGSQSAGNVLGPIRGYLGRLAAWAKKRATSYGVAAALIVVAILFIGIGCGVGTAALFHWIALHYGAWTAYGVIGGFFGAVGLSALLAAVILIKRRSPPLPTPPRATHLLHQVALPMANRVASKTETRTDATTRLLATGAALLLAGWAVTQTARGSHPESSRE